MFQEFFTKTIESKFIKNLLYNTPTPIYKVVRDGDYVFADNTYIYNGNIIRVDYQVDDSGNVLVDGSGYVGYIPDSLSSNIPTADKVKAQYSIIAHYVFGRMYPQFTERYISEYGYYDSGTHEALGQYLRCIRNLYNIDLMPFYNCFSGKYVSNLSIAITHKIDTYYLYYWNKYKMEEKISEEVTSERIFNGDFKAYVGSAIKYEYDTTEMVYKPVLINPSSDIPDNLEDKYLYVTLGDFIPHTGEIILDNFKLLQSPNNLLINVRDSKDVVIKCTDSTVFTQISDREFSITNFNTVLSYDNLPEEYEIIVGMDSDQYPTDAWEESYWYIYTTSTKHTTTSPYYKFQSVNDSEYKLIQIPIKLNQDYTVALETDCEIYLAPAYIRNGRLITILNENKAKIDLTAKLSSNVKRISSCKYKHPFLFRIDLTHSNSYYKYLAENERYLNLVIQIPATETTSVTVLEGNYLRDDNCITYFDWEDFNSVDQDQKDKVLLSRLSLLRLNCKTSYAFSNRLIEYLTKNAITSLEEIDDNIWLIQKAQGIYGYDTITKGVWDDRLRLYYHGFMRNNKRIEHCDLNGFIDKDTEKNYV